VKLEIRTDGVEFVVSREPLAKNDNEGRQKADRDTGELLYVTELVAMDDSGAEVIKVTTAGRRGSPNDSLWPCGVWWPTRGTSRAAVGSPSAPTPSTPSPRPHRPRRRVRDERAHRAGRAGPA
jgi:hypothetical protein